jgi:hypothetical protein
MKNKLFLTAITVFSILFVFCLAACPAPTDPDPDTKALLPAPQNLSAVVVSSTSIRLSWSPLDGATSYNVYRTTDSEWKSSILIESSVLTTTCTDKELEPATTYYYKVAAKKGYPDYTQGDLSEAATATTPSDTPPDETGKTPSDTPSDETGKTPPDTSPDETGKNKFFFIQTGRETEASGTLYYMVDDSTEPRVLSDKIFTSFFVKSGDSKVVFAEIISGYSGAYIGTMDIDGSGYHQTNERGFNPCLNNDSSLIYFDDGTDIYTMNLDGTDRKKFDIPEVTGPKKFPRLSPDGAKLAFYQESPGSKWYYDNVVYLYILDLSTCGVTKLNNVSIPVSYLNWSPDGEMIAFSTTTGITPPIHELWTVKTDGSEEPVRITDSGSPLTGACAYPYFIDNLSIVCASTKAKSFNYRSDWDGDHYKYELAKIGADGKNLSILLSNISIKDPAWITK